MLSKKQRAAYKKFNVSPADHDMMVLDFGDDHATLTEVVIERSASGMYRAPWPG